MQRTFQVHRTSSSRKVGFNSVGADMTASKPDSYINPAAPGVTVAARDWTGWLLAFLASLTFSFAPPIARGAINAGLDPTTLVMLRLVLAVLLIATTTLFMDRRRMQMDRRGLFITAIAGGLNGFGMLLMFWALARVDASVASMLISLLPLVVLTMLALRGERFTHRHTVRLVLGLAGVYLLIGPGGAVDGVGIILLLIANVCFAIHMSLLQWYLRVYDARAVTLYISAAMTVVVLSAWLAEGAQWQSPDWRGWLAILVLVVISTYLSRLLMVAAINRIGSGQMALLTPVETLLTITWSLLFLGERLAPLQLAGGALILASALLAIERLGRARWRPAWRKWI
jgi:drug/metabolite transporter (DMT)-like permease